MRQTRLILEYGKIRQTCLCVLLTDTLILSVSGRLFAMGAPAGSTVNNLATLSYTVAGVPLERSASATFRVDELIDLTLLPLDLSSRNALPGETDIPLTFRLTNTGNGGETFQLTLENLLTGNDFNPVASTPTAIYLDDGDGNLDMAVDTAYAFGVNDPLLAADESLTIFVLNDIPGTAIGGETGSSQLLAKSSTGSGTAWTTLDAGSGDGSTTAILGNSGGQAQARGTYLVTDVTLILNKSHTIKDPDGGSAPVPRAVVTYRILATVSGSGTLGDIVITDPVPANTTYIPGSLKLNTAVLSDGPADDAGDFDATNPNTITVRLGEMSNATPAQTIEFQVTID